MTVKRKLPLGAILFVWAMTGLPAMADDPAPADVLTLHPRSRIESPGDSGQYDIIYKTVRWEPKQTAIIICDMWARHWCDGACDRGAQMAPRINAFVGEARGKGVLIVHAPSGGMEHYADHPARKRAQDAPKAADLPDGIAGGCSQIEAEKRGTWPIDQSDGGCDDQPRCPERPMDLHQTAAIEIHDKDAISDSGVECWNLFAQRGVTNVMLVGVHTNMCVIGRPFGLRNMVRFGKNVLLVRDLTDTMYNPRRPPHVSHVRGTELIVEHIEKYVCPTITSSELLGGPAVRFKEDRRPHVVFVVSDDHYHADVTLPAFAEMLRLQYGCYCTVAHGQGTANFPGLAELERADVMVLFIRRLALPREQLAMIRKYLDAGRPLVALRTASHAFDVHGDPPAGSAEWPEFDAEVLGGNYHGHGPNEPGTDVAPAPQSADHPILAGIEPGKWHSAGSLYYASPIDPGATILLTGSSEGKTEPLAWTRTHNGGRIFYTSLGHPDDFKQPQFRQLLLGSIFWAMDRPVPISNKDVAESDKVPTEHR
ncbi:MAG: hypothetical protein A2V70_15445 [Planctomycetes bacterium RBG_13_63_9]|nr:MAG: hypothetical protein A2V70_15445 [Planctomycetes bacterium RBG_13_63_9]